MPRRGVRGFCEARLALQFCGRRGVSVEVHILDGAPGTTAATYEVCYNESEATVVSVGSGSTPGLTLEHSRSRWAKQQWLSPGATRGGSRIWRAIHSMRLFTPTAVQEPGREGPCGALGIGGGCSFAAAPHAPWAIGGVGCRRIFRVGWRWWYPQPRWDGRGCSGPECARTRR